MDTETRKTKADERSACVYCNATDRKITREHLWPQSLHRRLQTDRGISEDYFWVQRLDKTLATEPAIRDVCEGCNNGPLSALDAYGCSLWDDYFRHIHKRGDKIFFRYDYNLLLRWLLKLCYNSARIHRYDEFVYPPLRPYILNGERVPGRQQVFLQLVPPGHIPPADIPDERLPAGSARTYLPENHRIGFIQFRIPGAQKLLRAVHFRSFSFFIAFYEPGATPFEQWDFANEFAPNGSHIYLLRPDEAEIGLDCGGMDAWQSAREAQSIRFE